MDSANQQKKQYEIINAMGIPVVTKPPDDSYDIIIDGIFGVGLNRPIQGNIAEIIEHVNQYQGYKVSLDIPYLSCSRFSLPIRKVQFSLILA